MYVGPTTPLSVFKLIPYVVALNPTQLYNLAPANELIPAPLALYPEQLTNTLFPAAVAFPKVIAIPSPTAVYPVQFVNLFASVDTFDTDIAVLPSAYPVQLLSTELPLTIHALPVPVFVATQFTAEALVSEIAFCAPLLVAVQL